MITANRSGIKIVAKPEKVLARYLEYGGEERIRRMINQILSLEEQDVEKALRQVMEEFGKRHVDFKQVLLENYRRFETKLKEHKNLTLARRLLPGACFTHEYSVESAALFNPSIVQHPDQSGVRSGELRFLMSLMAAGEGHISSIEFASGVVSGQGDFTLDPSPLKLVSGRISGTQEQDSGYTITFDPGSQLGSRLIFPVSPDESNGIEDVRFVQLQDGEPSAYAGTYTAYDGSHIRSKIILTDDFLSFRIRALDGNAVTGKGMALFPEKIGGLYCMIGRQDGENISIMYSEDLYSWDRYQAIQYPRRIWELVQLGNCGSPVRTEAGWLLLTHAVGPMRKYVISASLLDLHKPEVVLASLDEPFLVADASEREGYVPNVVYTCGAIHHAGKLIMPYAMSDSAVGMATIDIQEILHALQNS
jgi:predicted GH43/DUF377 family glycosyl hydrolase